MVVLTVGLVLVWPARSSVSSTVTPPPPPSLDELRTIDELAEWVSGGEDGFEIFDDEEVGGVIRERRRSFELFRRYNDSGRRGDVLAGLPYGDLIHSVAETHRVDSLLLAAMVGVESSFDPGVISHQGAVGLMQLMPETATQYGAVDPRDPRNNLRAGARYFRVLLDEYEGDLELALAAYNAGPGNVRRFGGVPPFPETSRYVEKVLSTYIEYHRSLWHGSEVADLLSRLEPDVPVTSTLSGELEVPAARNTVEASRAG